MTDTQPDTVLTVEHIRRVQRAALASSADKLEIDRKGLAQLCDLALKGIDQPSGSVDVEGLVEASDEQFVRDNPRNVAKLCARTAEALKRMEQERDEQHERLLITNDMFDAERDALSLRVQTLREALEPFIENAEALDHDCYQLVGHEGFDPAASIEFARAALGDG